MDRKDGTGADSDADIGVPTHPDTHALAHPPTLPPHIAWPAFVILLLLIGIGSAFAALWAANSDGGAVLVRDPVEQLDP